MKEKKQQTTKQRNALPYRVKQYEGIWESVEKRNRQTRTRHVIKENQAKQKNEESKKTPNKKQICAPGPEPIPPTFP